MVFQRSAAAGERHIEMRRASGGPLHRHAAGKVALMFSGGKDSRALIELFRPYLDGIPVYHLDTGRHGRLLGPRIRGPCSATWGRPA